MATEVTLYHELTGKPLAIEVSDNVPADAAPAYAESVTPGYKLAKPKPAKSEAAKS